MRILVVDDEVDSLLPLSIQLEKWGHQVFAATDGLSAWKAFDEEQFGLVITDWMMQGLDGLELCRRIRSLARPAYTYVLMMTGKTGKQNWMMAMEAGADDFVGKPLDPDELAARLKVAERILGLQSQVKQLESLLPICMYCKNIRDTHNRWESVEHYITRRTETEFSHGICPDCYRAHVQPELDRLKS